MYRNGMEIFFLSSFFTLSPEPSCKNSTQYYLFNGYMHKYYVNNGYMVLKIKLFFIIEMKQLLWRLDYLCIELISINIHRYCKILKENWKLIYSNDLGERLIHACLSNSFEKINENVYEFILHNFFIQKFQIYDKIFEKIKHFDMINGKNFNKLKISLYQNIQLKNNKEKFKLTTNKLILYSIYDNNFFVQSFQFFSNLFVKKDLEIHLAERVERDENCKLEELLMILLENTSNEIESIRITFDGRTIKFLDKFTQILLERKNLKNLYLEELSQLTNFFLGVTFAHNFSNSIESLLHFNSIEYLNIEFPNYEIPEIFAFLNLSSIKNIRTLNIYYLDLEYYGSFNYKFLENCQNLESLTLSFITNSDKFNIFDIFLPISKTLKILDLNAFEIDDTKHLRNFMKFLSESSLQKIVLRRISFHEEPFIKKFQFLEHFHNTLTSLAIIDCNIDDEDLINLPKCLQKCHQLNNFEFKDTNFGETLLKNIYKSLQSSCKTLRSISIYRLCDVLMQLQSFLELINLLEKCKSLRKFELEIAIIDNKIPDLLLVLTKFQETLEIIHLTHQFSNSHFEKLLDFLSGCVRLKAVTGCFTIVKDTIGQALIKSLSNSKYSLKNLGQLPSENCERFPHIFYLNL